MQQFHERLLAEVSAERRRLSRRGMLSGSLKLAGGAAVALSLSSVPSIRNLVSAQEFASDLDVLNYALTLEHLEFAFYRDGIGLFDFGTDGFDQSINDNLVAIRDHEGAHVATLTDVITQLGGVPVAEAAYNFTDAYASVDGFLTTAAALENTGVSAYDGAAQFITDPGLLAAAGSIVAVEARHASY
ncbi:MAG: ferritin-like domain-containing protein, partial [Chloroflexia bacterium]|nr:ferritin-like domain-containing protein [Chloroflexia bacterium]